jgi:hypothetical protein
MVLFLLFYYIEYINIIFSEYRHVIKYTRILQNV